MTAPVPAPLPDRLPPKVRALLAQAVAAERADMLAYLARRAGNARRIAEADSTYCEWARDRACQLEIIAGDVRAGLHEGLAEMMGRLENDRGKED